MDGSFGADAIRWGVSYLAGGLSGLLGGLVGNQGGIRSAALLAFDVPKTTFVAVATATALVVDGARLPVYLYQEHARLLQIWPAIAVATVGVMIGTAAGGDLLRRVPDRLFRRVVAVTLLVLGHGDADARRRIAVNSADVWLGPEP